MLVLPYDVTEAGRRGDILAAREELLSMRSSAPHTHTVRSLPVAADGYALHNTRGQKHCLELLGSDAKGGKLSHLKR